MQFAISSWSSNARAGSITRPKRAFAAAGFEVRIVHPFTTKQFRQPAHPGLKTDDTDLAAIHRATVTGCALVEATRDEAWTTLLLLIRQRRDLVRKGAALNCQIRDHLEAALPGIYLPLYTMVTFTRIPYAEAARRAQMQDRLIYTVFVVLGIALVSLVIKVLG